MERNNDHKVAMTCTVQLLLIKELERIELGEPCQLFKLNERNRTLCTKVDCFLY